MPKTIFEEIVHFSLEILPKDPLLAFNPALGTFALLASTPERPYPYLLWEQQFTAGELDIVLPLLQCYPAIVRTKYCWRVITMGPSKSRPSNVRASNCMRRSLRGSGIRKCDRCATCSFMFIGDQLLNYATYVWADVSGKCRGASR